MTSIAEDVVATEISAESEAARICADEAPAITDHVNGSEADGALPVGSADLSAAVTADGPSVRAEEPFVRVVKGSPTDEELAALVSVLAAAAASGTAPAGSSLPPETWGDPVRMHRVAAPFSPYSFAQIGSHRL